MEEDLGDTSTSSAQKRRWSTDSSDNASRAPKVPTPTLKTQRKPTAFEAEGEK